MMEIINRELKMKYQNDNDHGPISIGSIIDFYFVNLRYFCKGQCSPVDGEDNPKQRCKKVRPVRPMFM